ncbi:ABC transporter ATP-binding protein [Serratia entomophila]|uniref:ABC transporter ATP-binding protein n=1 Tax=Serratia entomophila TaxID=42906 RepID=UPI00217B7839|nr:sn-glycerol-3-phosphate ABC transporter ATP-binding protein UgpC [Serratia entomophila]CAI1057814.1 sn-glycerol-3-phosphate import ATP-binding protein UgpC [Serratia entomophila]CAI1790129.1 sn-glycerol-3-phosphate import ATP-binding protein UgpC [Serratia entomophila]CAI1830342.1 sn-glycerol-3-phosphate import ATP-binding protein UgpC [Serratia entomophila]CAI1843877.1 sn-glycerol-3-phosphate import ATP-binding protein UgpC [Serratia entomophila]CAI1913915.1 sn-glycerol-3-phosphate import 
MRQLLVSGITLSNVTKVYGKGSIVIPSCSITLPAGQFTVILGPSGCGKSTLLRMIAGLESVSSGTISIGGTEVQDKEPKDRGCAMVFQNYALYPHMSVARNIGYSLKVMGMPKSEIESRVCKVAEAMGLSTYLDRQPHELSGGQRQRVAIGRAIVREPTVLLFDEPLSNLDAQLRNDMRIELSELHKRINATSVFVTHDQVEAMTLADQILILNKGVIEQFGSPIDIYHRPASVFVAEFIGSPAMNIFSVDIRDGKVWVGGKIISSVCPEGVMGKALMGIRPEDIILNEEDGLSFTLLHREDLGSHSILHGTILDNITLRMVTPFGLKVPDLKALNITIPLNKCHFFDIRTSKNLNIYASDKLKRSV